MGQLKVTDLIKTNQVLLVKKHNMGILPSSLEPLFIYKKGAGEKCKCGAPESYSNQLKGTYNCGIFPISEIINTWNSLDASFKAIHKINSLKI